MAPRIIRIDFSGSTALPLCRACPWRGAPVGTREEARRQADEHRRRAHPDSYAGTAKKRRARAVAL